VHRASSESPRCGARHVEYLGRCRCARASRRSIPRSLSASAAIGIVLLLDVLEHLYDPWRRPLPGSAGARRGYAVLASVPNIRNLVNSARARRRRNGNMAPTACSMSTHVRFFTRAYAPADVRGDGLCRHAHGAADAPAWVDRYVIARRPGKLVTKNLIDSVSRIATISRISTRSSTSSTRELPPRDDDRRRCALPR
jgi:hypothetical protein